MSLRKKRAWITELFQFQNTKERCQDQDVTFALIGLKLRLVDGDWNGRVKILTITTVEFNILISYLLDWPSLCANSPFGTRRAILLRAFPLHQKSVPKTITLSLFCSFESKKKIKKNTLITLCIAIVRDIMQNRTHESSEL